MEKRVVEVVNVVGSGALDVELDLSAVARELGDLADYDPNKYPGLYLRLSESRPLVTLYRTGKYIITGASSEKEATDTREELLSILSDHDILQTARDDWFTIQNYVCMADAGRELNLSALAIGLGLEITEYEPEQFPGLVYRPQSQDCVLLIFNSGKVVVTGASNISSANDSVSDLFQQIESLI